MTNPFGIDTSAFRGAFVPAAVRLQVINLLVSGAVFAPTLTRESTDRSTVAYPTASPTGFRWLGQGEQFPQLDTHDDAATYGVCKLGGLLSLSNELVLDSTVNITATVGDLLRDSMSRELDERLLHGQGDEANQPRGVVPAADVVSAADLHAGIAQAVGEIGDAGGQPSHIALSATALASANAQRDATGQLVYPNGIAAAFGLAPVAVPGLAEVLVYDSSRLRLVINGQDSELAISTDYQFSRDVTTLRLKVRAAVAMPDRDKAIRRVEVAGGLTVRASKAK